MTARDKKQPTGHKQEINRRRKREDVNYEKVNFNFLYSLKFKFVNTFILPDSSTL